MKKPLFVLIAVIIGISAAFLRVETIYKRPLWYDEIFTLNVCSGANSLTDVFSVAERDGSQHPALFYAISYLSYSSKDRSIRIPSAIAGILFILLLMYLATRILSPGIGLTAGLLSTLSVYHINYSMDARPYSILVLFTVAQYCSLYFLYKRTHALSLLLFVVIGIANSYTHHTALITQAAMISGFIGTAFYYWGSKKREKFLWKFSAYLALGLLLIGIAYYPQAQRTATFLGSENLAKVHSLNISPRFFYDLASRWGSGSEAAAVAYLLFAIGGLIASYRKNKVIFFHLCFSLCSSFLVFSIVPFQKFFDIRFLIISLPAFFLCVAIGICAFCKTAKEAIENINFKNKNIVSFLGGLPAMLIIGSMSWSSLDTYLTFRETNNRCSNFFYNPSLLTDHDGFCAEHIILNSLNPNNKYILIKRNSRVSKNKKL